MKKYIPREAYISKVIPYVNKELIKVFVGQRRVGKSYLMYQLLDYIKKKDSSCNIIYINKDLNENFAFFILLISGSIE